MFALAPMRTLVFLLAFGIASAVYLPGVIPHEYHIADEVEIFVDNVVSKKTLIPYSYYSLPVCTPDKLQSGPRNLGRVLSGSHPYKSLYGISMLKTTFPSCELGCGSGKSAIMHLSQGDVLLLSKLIDDGYHAEWIVDNLPVALQVNERNQQGQTFKQWTPRFPLGKALVTQEQQSRGADAQFDVNNVLYNHHAITIHYHRDVHRFKGFRIVGVSVVPSSVQHSTQFADLDTADAVPLTCFNIDNAKPLYLNTSRGEGMDVVWTYSVSWTEDATEWASRWDRFFVETEYDAHEMALFSGLAIVIPICILTAAIFWRTCGGKRGMSVEDELEQTGWKLVHGDVFRQPARPILLSVLVGTGSQIALVVALLAFFSVLGMLAPPNRGAALSALVSLTVLCSAYGGFMTARAYKTMQGVSHRALLAVSVLAIPLIVFVFYFAANVVLWVHSSSAGLSAGMSVALLAMFIANAILTGVGLLAGLRKGKVIPTKPINSIPRYIPIQPWYLYTPLTLLAAGVIPFGAFWIEQYYLMQAIWSYSYISSFIFVFLALLFLSLCSALVAILAVFLRLRCEDYHWWWPAFLHGAAPSIYITTYAIYYVRYLELVPSAPLLLYLCYTAIIAIAITLFLGAVGFTSSLIFVRNIYSRLSVE